MGFVFGMVDYLNATTSVTCFILVIAFVVVVDFILGVTEHILAENPIYDRIFRILYKELMMMGLITFIIIMLEALYEEGDPDFYLNIDFAHILIFFQTLFFAAHAVLLIRMSFIFAKMYRHFGGNSLKDLLNQMRVLKQNCFTNYLLQFRLIPMLPVIRSIEYKVLQTLFDSHYYLPPNFNFAAYLSGCFARFALKAVNRSLTTWAILAILFVLNFARLKTGLSCAREYHASESSHRLLGGSSETVPESATGDSIHSCRANSIRYFLMGGAVLVAYALLLLIVSRIYKLRLMKFAGVETSDDYLTFLEYSELHEEDVKNHYSKSYRLDTEELRNTLEHNIHSIEDEEDEEGFKATASFLVRLLSRANRRFYRLRMDVRIFFVTLFCPGKLQAIDEADRFVVSNEKSEQEDTLALEVADGGDIEMTSSGDANDRSSTTGAPSLSVPPPINTKPKRSILESSTPGSGRSSVSSGGGMSTRMRIEARIDSMSIGRNENDRQYRHNHDYHVHNKDEESAREKFMKLLEVRHTVISAVRPDLHEASMNTSTSGKGNPFGGLYRVTSNSDDSPSHGGSSKHGSPHSGNNSPHQGGPQRSKSITEVRPRDMNRKRTASGHNHEDSDDEEDLRLPSFTLIGFYRFKQQKKLKEERNNQVERHVDETGNKSKTELLREHAYEVLANADFQSVYLFGSPLLYFRMVELCIMFNCLFMAVWVTNMITVTKFVGFPHSWQVLTQLGMCLPFVIVFFMLAYISEACSLLEAFIEINPQALLKVLDDTLDRASVVERVQKRMLFSISRRVHEELTDQEIVHRIFSELDVDGSGALDEPEIAHLLHMLKIKLDSKHFRFLMRELQNYRHDGCIDEQALCLFLFPAQEKSLEDSEAYVKRMKKDLVQKREEVEELLASIQIAESQLKGRKLSNLLEATNSLSRKSISEATPQGHAVYDYSETSKDGR